MTPEQRRIHGILDLLAAHPATPAADADIKVGVEGLDDCAVTSFNDDYDLVIGSDFVRGEGFLLYQKGYMSAEQVGWYLTGANLSDIAAMGAKPLGMVAATRYTKNQTDDHFLAILSGIIKAAATYNAPLLGGDTGSYESPVLSAAAFGLVPKGRALLRRNARAGDALYLTGTVGSAGAAFALLSQKPDVFTALSPDIIDTLCAPWRRVEPALAHGAFLTETSLSTCALDTSDGLYTSCRLLAESAEASIVLDARSIPIGAGVVAAAESLGLDPLTLACGDSVDFRLLFTVPATNVAALEDGLRARGLPFFRIGQVIAPDPAAPVWLAQGGAVKPFIAAEKTM